MILEELIDKQVDEIKTEYNKDIDVVGILVKDINILKDNFSVILWDRKIRHGCIIGVVIIGKYKNIPIILNENMTRDINLEFTWKVNKSNIL